MVLDMQFADGTLLRVREPAHLDPVSITPGLGTHRLLVRAEVEPVKVAPGCNLALLDGELHAEHPTGPRWVGSLHPVAVPLRTNPPGWLADLVVALTDAQVLALEKDRNGHDLQVRLDLRASLPQSREHAVASGQDTRRVPASTWEGQIQQLGRAVSFTVTIPLPMDGGPLADAAHHLRQADQQITSGEYADAVRQARLAIEAMRDLQVWPKQVAKPRDEQTQADRYGVIPDKLAAQADGDAELLQALFNQASGPQHTSGALRGRGGSARTRSPSPAWPPRCCTGLPRRSPADGPVQRASVAAISVDRGGNNPQPRGLRTAARHAGPRRGWVRTGAAPSTRSLPLRGGDGLPDGSLASASP